MEEYSGVSDSYFDEFLSKHNLTKEKFNSLPRAMRDKFLQELTLKELDTKSEEGSSRLDKAKEAAERIISGKVMREGSNIIYSQAELDRILIKKVTIVSTIVFVVGILSVLVVRKVRLKSK